MSRVAAKYWGSQAHEKARRRPVDPYLQLAYSVVKRATVELKDKDPLESLPALCWWLSEDARGWLTMLELCDPEDDSYFEKVIRSCVNGKIR